MPEDTIFHRIMRREIPADIVHEEEDLIVFRDINPASPLHLLIVPKKTLPSLAEVTAEDAPLLGRMLVVASELAIKMGVATDGYRVVMNCGEHAGQTVFQLHLHLLAGRDFSWPPG